MCIRPSIEYFYECSMLRRNIGLMTTSRFPRDLSFAVRCSRHTINNMKNANQAIAAGAALMNCVNWSKISDLQGLIVVAQKKGGFANQLTNWIQEEVERRMLEKIGYPIWVKRRVIPEIDELEPTKLIPGHVSVWKHNDIGNVIIQNPHGHDVYQLAGRADYLIGFQTLMFLRDNPNEIPSDLYGQKIHGCRIWGWRSVVDKRIEHVGQSKLAPVLYVPDPNKEKGRKLEIEWRNLSDSVSAMDISFRIRS